MFRGGFKSKKLSSLYDPKWKENQRYFRLKLSSLKFFGWGSNFFNLMIVYHIEITYPLPFMLEPYMKDLGDTMAKHVKST